MDPIALVAVSMLAFQSPTRDAADTRSATQGDNRASEHVVTDKAADLDGDGRPERISLVAVRDPDAAREGDDRGELTVAVSWNGRVLESRTMAGVALPLEIAALGSRRAKERTTVILAGAAHCGGSCAGMELVVLALRDGALVPLLDLEDLGMGEIVVTRGGALETREAIPDPDHAAPSRERVTHYELRGGALVPTSETARRAKPANGAHPRIRVER